MYTYDLLSFINAEGKIILSLSSDIWYYDSHIGSIAESDIGDSHSVQFQSGGTRMILLPDSVFSDAMYDSRKLAGIIIDQIMLDGKGYSDADGNSSLIGSNKVSAKAASGFVSSTMKSAQNAYSGPSGSIYAQIGSVDKGEKITVMSYEQDWFYIEYYVTGTSNRKRGYVPASSVNCSTSSVTHLNFKSGYYNAAKSDINVYFVSSLNGLTVGSVDSGEGVTVLGVNSNLSYIEYSSPSKTKRGYVHTSDLAGRKDGTIGIVTASTAVMYAGTDTHFYSVGSADKNEYTVILRTDGLWAFVEYNTPSGRKRGYTVLSGVSDHLSLASIPSIPKKRDLAVANSNMTVYDGPNSHYATIGTIYGADQINVLIRNEYGWSYVEYYTGSSASKRGYIGTGSYTSMSLTSLPAVSGGTIIQYGSSRKGRALNAYKIGSGANVLFAVCEQHGFEDAWAADGIELVKIGDALISGLKNSSYLSKWTIYVIPSANPDGLLDGYTNDGPGRCTIDDYDMNRSHDTLPFTAYTASTDSRNHTGALPKASIEVSRLETFVSEYKSKSAQNVLLDVHGWEDKTIGDAAVSKFFDNAMGLKHVSNSGSSGFLIKWAMQNGINASLVEMPLLKNPAAVKSYNLTGKMVSAVSNLIANMGKSGSTHTPIGWIDAVNTSVISGWAEDSSNPTASINVDIYIKSKTSGKTIRKVTVPANNYRSDVTPGSHGFSYSIDWRTFAPDDYNIYVYGLGGSNPQLSGSPKSFHVSASTGNCDYINSKGIDGWVWKPQAPDSVISARICIYNSSNDKVYDKTVSAGNYRKDLVNAGKGNGYHGFNTAVDWTLLPSGSLKVMIYAVDGSGVNPTIYKENIENPAYTYEQISVMMKNLFDAAAKFEGNNKSKNTILALQYIRIKRSSYTGVKWSVVAGNPDSKFVDYVTKNYGYLDSYFKSDINMYDPVTRNYMDFNHFIATINGLYYDSILDEYLNDLCGWAGDLQTLENDMIDDTNNSDDYDTCYTYAKKYLGGNAKSFNIHDMLADIDALNIYYSSNIFDEFKDYYDNMASKRFKLFYNKGCCDSALEYTKPFDLGITDVPWLLQKSTPTSNQATALANAFTDYIKEQMRKER